MPDVALGNFIALIFDELADALTQSRDSADRLRLRVSDVDLDVPAYVRVPGEAGGGVLLGLPSLRQMPEPGRLGRLRVTIETISPATGDASDIVTPPG